MIDSIDDDSVVECDREGAVTEELEIQWIGLMDGCECGLNNVGENQCEINHIGNRVEVGDGECCTRDGHLTSGRIGVQVDIVYSSHTLVWPLVLESRMSDCIT